jgi:hypothetical protein
MTDTITGTAEEIHDDVEPSAPLPVRAAPPSLAVTPQVSATELVERLAVIREAQDKAMVKDVDYGIVPGTAKPTLLKPGAEKLGVLFQLDIEPETTKTWGPGDHLTVECTATVYHAPTGARLGKGEGICSTREKKYAKRKQERVCPVCNMPAVIKGKQEYGGGWLCFKKKDGCGAKWPDGAEEIESQPVGEIENPDLPDLWNTVVKMAEKRARVDAVLAVTGASALFTQDAEDSGSVPAGEPVPAETAPPAERKASPSEQRTIYELASGRLSGVQLLHLLHTVQGKAAHGLDEQAAVRRIGDEVRGLPGDRVQPLLRAIRAATTTGEIA